MVRYWKEDAPAAPALHAQTIPPEDSNLDPALAQMPHPGQPAQQQPPPFDLQMAVRALQAAGLAVVPAQALAPAPPPLPAPIQQAAPPRSKRGHSSAPNSPTKPKRQRKPKKEKENTSGGDVIEIEEDKVVASIHWTPDQRTTLFKWLMGPDADARWKVFLKGPGGVFKEAEKALFNGQFTHGAIKGQYNRSLVTYNNIVVFEEFTGNGGGDGDMSDAPDADDDLAQYEARLKGAKKVSKPVGNLTAKVIKEWYDHGWFEIFDSRHGASPKVRRDVPRDSATALSDDDDPFLAGADTDSNSAPSTPSSISKARVDAKSSDPKHRRALSSALTSQSADIAGYLKQKAERDEEKALFQRERLELDRHRVEARERELALKRAADEKQAKLDLAKQVVNLEGATAEAKAAANALILAALGN